eukprot:1147349-Pelagomonas_calceolata.AAC.6
MKALIEVPTFGAACAQQHVLVETSSTLLQEGAAQEREGRGCDGRVHGLALRTQFKEFKAHFAMSALLPGLIQSMLDSTHACSYRMTDILYMGFTSASLCHQACGKCFALFWGVENFKSLEPPRPWVRVT